MNTGSLRLGTLFGVRVNLHWSVLIIAMLLTASLTRLLGLAVALVAVVAFLASILAHEMAHALMARRFGVGTESVQLWALGGVARLEREAPTARAEGWIAAAGPIASAAISIVAVAVWSLVRGTESTGSVPAVLSGLGFINGALALFNLLPGAPLDGGRILKAVRWSQHGDRFRAAREAARAGVVLGWVLGAIGFALVMRAQGGVWLVVTGLFIAVNAKVEIAAADLGSRLAGIRVRDITWFGVAHAGPDMDADSMLWDRRRLGGAGGVAVVDDGGVPQGVVLEDQLWAIPADERPWVMLTQMMVPFAGTAEAAPDDDLASVLPRLNPARPIVTVWEHGRLIGLVPPGLLQEQLGLT